MSGAAAEVPLADQLAIQAVLARYCHRCDDGDFDGVAALFTEDSVFSYDGDTSNGRVELAAYLLMNQGKPGNRGRHLTVNTVLEADGDGVRAVSDFVFLRFAGSGRLVPAITGRYHDRLVRVDDTWQLARRDATSLRPPG